MEDRLKLNFPAQDISAGAFADSLNPKDSDEEVDELGPDVPYRGST